MISNKKNKGFSLIELSITIIVISLLIAGIVGSKNLINLAALSKSRSLTISSPVATTEDLAIWLETTSKNSFDNIAPSNNEVINNWMDINPQTNNKTNATAVNPPNYIKNGLNGLPVISFSANDYMTFDPGSFGSGNEQYTFILVAKNKADSGGAGYFDMLVGSTNRSIFLRNSSGLNVGWYSNNLVGGTINLTEFYILATDYDQNGRNLYINGSIVASDSSTVKNTDGRNHANVNVEIAEFIVFLRALSDFERREIETYLSKKWEIALTS